MAHPKRRQSTTRSRKRRTHYKAETPNVVDLFQRRGRPHMFHRAHWYEGKLYYKGRVVMEKEGS